MVDPRKDMDLHEVLVGALQALAGEAQRRGAELILQAQALHCTVPGDRHELQQMVLNLLLDGMAAMDQTHFAWRRVVVATRDCDDEGCVAGSFQVTARPGGGNVCTVTLPCRRRPAAVLPVLAVGPAATPRLTRWAVLT
jgi:hypothetical protein